MRKLKRNHDDYKRWRQNILLDYLELCYYIQNLIGHANYPTILPVLYCQAHEASPIALISTQNFKV